MNKLVIPREVEQLLRNDLLAKSYVTFPRHFDYGSLLAEFVETGTSKYERDAIDLYYNDLRQYQSHIVPLLKRIRAVFGINLALTEITAKLIAAYRACFSSLEDEACVWYAIDGKVIYAATGISKYFLERLAARSRVSAVESAKWLRIEPFTELHYQLRKRLQGKHHRICYISGDSVSSLTTAYTLRT